MKLITSNLKKKLGGLHTTIIGGRESYKVISHISNIEKIKNIIPSVICNKNKSKKGGLVLKVQRPDDHGNLRLLLSFGSSCQEIRLITKVSNSIEGTQLQSELNEIIKKLKK